MSRNPQWVMVMMGIAIAIGSWVVVILVLGTTVLGHLYILAKEQQCLEQYGESYQRYMER